MTPEFDSRATHEACAPLHWDVEEWDFRSWLEDDESLTDGEDLQFLLDGELEDEDDDDDESWDGTTPRKRRKTTSRLRRTRWQGVSCAPGCPTKMTAGTPMTEPIVMMAPPVMTALKMMAAMGAAATAMSAQVLRSSTISSSAPTGGSVDVPSQ
jgi:hypothetical protein